MANVNRSDDLSQLARRSSEHPASPGAPPSKWRVQALWADSVVDEFTTDDDATKDILVSRIEDDGYEARVSSGS